MLKTTMANQHHARQRGKRLEHRDKRKDGNAYSLSQIGRLQYSAHNTMLVKLSSQGNQAWYQYEESLKRRDLAGKQGRPDKGLVSVELASKYRAIADDIYRTEIQIFGNMEAKNDDNWVEGTIRKGTLKDRIAAMSVIVSNDPIHKFHAIDGLLHMAADCTESVSGQPNSRVAQLAAEALEDLFVTTLLPKDRKLRALDQRSLPLLETDEEGEIQLGLALSPRTLLLWRFEEMVKQKFDIFVRHYLARTLREGLEITKVSALRTAGTLLLSVPEGEAQVRAFPVLLKRWCILSEHVSD